MHSRAGTGVKGCYRPAAQGNRCTCRTQFLILHVQYNYLSVSTRCKRDHGFRPEKNVTKYVPSERASHKDKNATNLHFVALSSKARTTKNYLNFSQNPWLIVHSFRTDRNISILPKKGYRRRGNYKGNKIQLQSTLSSEEL